MYKYSCGSHIQFRRTFTVWLSQIYPHTKNDVIVATTILVVLYFTFFCRCNNQIYVSHIHRVYSYAHKYKWRWGVKKCIQNMAFFKLLFIIRYRNLKFTRVMTASCNPRIYFKSSNISLKKVFQKSMASFFQLFPCTFDDWGIWWHSINQTHLLLIIFFITGNIFIL